MTKVNRPRDSAAQARSEWRTDLTELEARRAPYAAVLRPLIAEALSAGRGRTLEVGAGNGQLRQLLGDPEGDWVHTECDPASLRLLKRRFPGRSILHADLEALPFEAASFSRCVGLCVMDVVNDLAVAARELHRVLSPGGTFIHLFDMTTVLERPFLDLVAADMLPVPNVLTNPSANLWPENLLVLPRPAARKILELGREISPTLHGAFKPYFDVFLNSPSRPLDTQRAVQLFHAIADAPELRRALALMLVQAQQLGLRRGLGRVPALPVSSAKHVSQRIRRAFEAAGFSVERDEIATGWSLVDQPLADLSSGTTCAYRSLCVGHERRDSQLPDPLLCEGAPRPQAGQQLIEVGLHVLAARREALGNVLT